MALYPFLRPLMFGLDAERAHGLTIKALKTLPPGIGPKPDPMLAVTVAGLDFPNPVGLAAGFDKNAEVFGQMLAPRLRLRGGRHADAAAAARKPAPAPVPACRGPRGDQPHGLQQ